MMEASLWGVECELAVFCMFKNFVAEHKEICMRWIKPARHAIASTARYRTGMASQERPEPQSLPHRAYLRILKKYAEYCLESTPITIWVCIFVHVEQSDIVCLVVQGNHVAFMLYTRPLVKAATSKHACSACCKNEDKHEVEWWPLSVTAAWWWKMSEWVASHWNPRHICSAQGVSRGTLGECTALQCCLQKRPTCWQRGGDQRSRPPLLLAQTVFLLNKYNNVIAHKSHVPPARR